MSMSESETLEAIQERFAQAAEERLVALLAEVRATRILAERLENGELSPDDDQDDDR